jgi:hypothetical protein
MPDLEAGDYQGKIWKDSWLLIAQTALTALYRNGRAKSRPVCDRFKLISTDNLGSLGQVPDLI